MFTGVFNYKIDEKGRLSVPARFREIADGKFFVTYGLDNSLVVYDGKGFEDFVGKLKKADQLGLFIFDKQRNGNIEVRHSMRLKCYRRAEQDVEYLELLRKKMKWTPGQLRLFIDHYLDTSGRVMKKFTEDAGTPVYNKLSPESFRQLREAAAKLLEDNR